MTTRREPDREPRTQYAALPWRRAADGQIEILLITSRETRRWVIPKGWPMKNIRSADVAAKEAFEEAGAIGVVDRRRVGVFDYDKRLKSGRLQHVKVSVFALRVIEEAQTYPELGQREKAWVSPAEAAARVDEPELKALLTGFSP